MKKLKQSDYALTPTKLAAHLLGKVLVMKKISGRIVETEAYGGGKDPASHGNRGETPRNRVMFGPPGHLYVYFTYGMHYCANVVAGKSGESAGVLLRALAPISGIPTMQKNRNMTELENLCSGPAKLTQALGITTRQNGTNLISGSGIYIYDDGYKVGRYKTSPRIGISIEKDNPEKAPKYRYYIPGEPNLSRKDRQ